MLRELRQRRGWSQERLAHEAGYDRAYVGQLERGTRWPTLEAVWYILAALDIGWDEFGHVMASEPALRQSPAPRTEA